MVIWTSGNAKNAKYLSHTRFQGSHPLILKMFLFYFGKSITCMKKKTIMPVTTATSVGFTRPTSGYMQSTLVYSMSISPYILLLVSISFLSCFVPTEIKHIFYRKNQNN